MTSLTLTEKAGQEIGDLFHEAVESFPPHLRDAARLWLAEREAALKLVDEIETKGLEALL